MAKHLNRHFIKENRQMNNQHVKKYPMPLVIRHMKTKTTVTYQYRTMTIAKNKKKITFLMGL